MNCIRSIYRLLFKRKETPIIKTHDSNLNTCLIIGNMDPTYETNKTSSTF